MATLPDIRKVYEFLRKHYKHERFEGRGKDYAQTIATSTLEILKESCSSFISRHESADGEPKIFDGRLILFSAKQATYSAKLGKWILPT